ncbi:hypothetical protein PR048_009148 [Dryococelus australis]|uniref:DNA-directed DNA polymerase n=1 Tax=Dryococelus australis TaxID=614101 RepID=A0ABQ9HZ24_9NEOP|nr:hypothetical protein PR048_009148 [Dryococelus australis]
MFLNFLNQNFAITTSAVWTQQTVGAGGAATLGDLPYVPEIKIHHVRYWADCHPLCCLARGRNRSNYSTSVDNNIAWDYTMQGMCELTNRVTNNQYEYHQCQAPQANTMGELGRTPKQLSQCQACTRPLNGLTDIVEQPLVQTTVLESIRQFLLAFHQGDADSIPPGNYRFLHVGIVPDDAVVGRFSLISPISLAVSFQCSSKLTFIILIGSQDLDKAPLKPRRMLHETIPKTHSFCYYVKYEHGYYKLPVTYEGPDASTVFVKMLMEEAKSIGNIYTNEKLMLPLSQKEQIVYDTATHCHICEKTLNGDSVRDHDHLTGKFRNKCFVPVFIHSQFGYDTHLFIRDLGIDENKIDLILNNEEKYIYFMKHVCGSQPFISQFLETCKHFSNELLDFVKRKGVYPYDYMNSAEKFSETSLPSKDAFYNKLNKCSITGKDYEFARKVWDKFNIKSLRE